MTQNMQRINELVFDEEKIVTSSLLGHELDIMPTETQNLLQSFVKEHKSENLQITYLLSGVLSDSRLAVCLVQEKDLETKKKEFETISNEVIFSIQKCQNIDFNLIALTDSRSPSRPALISKNCIKRNITKKSPVEIPAASKPKNSPFSSFKSTDSSNSDTSKPELQNGKSQSSQKSKPQKGIANFFSKATQKPQNTAHEPEVIITEEDPIIEEEKMDVDVGADEKTEIDIKPKKKTEVVKEEKKTETSKIKKNEKKRKKENKNDGPNKKRKRIQQICDSDSDDMFGEPENDIVGVSDEEPPSPPKPVYPAKKKVRKAIDKTYLDDEGFVVTKTEYIYESEPEEEPPKQKETAPVKKIERNNSDSKPATGKGKNNKKQVNGKQPTLMNFFKKV